MGLFISKVATPDIFLNGMALRKQPKWVRNDKALVMTCVEDCGLALQYASAKLRADPEIIWAAIKHDPDALQYVNPKVWKNYDSAYYLVSCDKKLIDCVDKTIRDRMLNV